MPFLFINFPSRHVSLSVFWAPLPPRVSGPPLRVSWPAFSAGAQRVPGLLSTSFPPNLSTHIGSCSQNFPVTVTTGHQSKDPTHFNLVCIKLMLVCISSITEARLFCFFILFHFVLFLLLVVVFS